MTKMTKVTPQTSASLPRLLLPLFLFVLLLASGTAGAGAADRMKRADYKGPYVTLNSGHIMPMLGLGTWTLSDKEAEQSVYAAIEEGYRLIFLAKTGKHIEVMVYGDGAFKDPQGKIWELADPVVSPAYTEGLEGTPNELKLKYLADNDFKDLSGEELKEAISKSIAEKKEDLVGNMASQGTTPRQLTDLIGSLSDLTSGSGDKGTPVVLIQGYFDNYTN